MIKTLSARTLSFFSLMCLLVPLAIFGLWIYVSNQGGTHLESVLLFNDYLPSFLQAGFSTAVLSLVFCAAAIFLSNKALNSASPFWRAVNYVVLMISGVLLFLNIWQML